MSKRIFIMAAVALVTVLPCAAQSSDSHSSAFKFQYEIVKGYVTKSAEKMSAELYSFKPTPEVRSFAALLAHIADTNYGICAMAKGEKSPVEMGSIEKSGKTGKTDMQMALADSYKFCDSAFAALTAANEGETVKLFGKDQTKLSTLAFNTAHNFEHYGNLVTYMRLKNIVPPSSEPRPQA